jgi:hypothetical protein
MIGLSQTQDLGQALRPFRRQHHPSWIAVVTAPIGEPVEVGA